MAKQYFVSNDGTILHSVDMHYPCPTPFGNHLCGLEVLEGVDFRLQHQWLSTAPTSFKQWKDCTIEQYNSEKYPEERRIIAVPTAAIENREVYFPCTTNDASSVIFNSPSKEETQEELWDEGMMELKEYVFFNKQEAYAIGLYVGRMQEKFTITRKPPSNDAEQQKQWEKEAEELFPYNPINMIDISPAERKAYIKGCQIQAARTLPAETNTLESAEELWDEFSEHVDSDIDSLQYIAGSVIMKRSDFIKALSKFSSQYRSQQQVDPVKLLK